METVNVFPMPPFCTLSFSARLSSSPDPVLFYNNWGGGRGAGAAVVTQLVVNTLLLLLDSWGCPSGVYLTL